MSHLMLDIAFPTSPTDVVGDCRAVGADSVALYVYNASIPDSVRSQAFIQQVVSEGINVLPIIVPGQGTPDVNNDIVHAIRVNSGFDAGPVVLDIETGSNPPAWWISAAIAGLRRAGYDPGIYCNPSSYAVLVADTANAWKWRADWTFQRGDPPPGWDAWQYSDQETVNGHRYDISTVTDGRVFTGANMPLDPNNANDKLVIDAANAILAKDADKAPDGNPIDMHWTVHFVYETVKDILSILADSSGSDPNAWLRQFLETQKNTDIHNIQVAVDKLSQPQVDASAVASALANNPAFLSAIASAVAKEFGKDLSNG